MLQELLPLFASLNSHNARYLVIGGVAAISYGVPRLTLDLDPLIEPTNENANAVLAAFSDSGLEPRRSRRPRLSFDGNDGFSGPGADRRADPDARHRVFHCVRAPQCDRDRRRHGTARFLADLIARKRAAGRPRDLEDVRLLDQSEEG